MIPDSFKTNYRFLNTRNYVHGTTIISDFLDALGGCIDAPVTISNAKFFQELSSNGDILIRRNHLNNSEVGSSWKIKFSILDQSYAALHVPDHSIIKNRQEVFYTIDDVKLIDYASMECIFLTETRESFIQHIVEANKRAHEHTLGKEKIASVRMGFIENFSMDYLPLKKQVPLKIMNKFHYVKGNTVNSINELSYLNGQNKKMTVMIGFVVTLY